MFKWFKKKKKEDEEIIKKVDCIESDIENEGQSDRTAFDTESRNELNKESDSKKEGLFSFIKKESKEEKITEVEKEEEKIIEKDEGGFFKRIFKGLEKTRQNLNYKLHSVFSEHDIDDDFFDELEEILVTSDVGVETVLEIIDNLKESIKIKNIHKAQDARPLLKEEIKRVMKENVKSNDLDLEPSPAVLLVVGVNGAGKTTTIGKLAYQFKEEGKSVLIAAADTFRAAAIDQLDVWAKRANVDIIAHEEGSDPASVVFDAIHAAKSRKTDILICDTAGRLHNKQNLMNELNKISRIIEREYPNATKETILVLDATTGQNAMIQAKSFQEVTKLTGVCVTKLDGTAKGGIIIALENELKLPVKIIGVGEKITDLQPFDTDDFVEALF